MHIPVLSELNSFYKRKIQPGFHVGKNDLVVDIGSGDKPFWRGDVFMDMLSMENNQRITETETVHTLGIFVDGDVTKSPFKNKVFDFSFCSHLLEHVERPDLAINEITRISKAGYIETPNGLIESIEPYQSHLWFVYFANSKLTFVRKSKKMHALLKENGKKYRYLYNKINEPFIRFYWKGKIDYEVIDTLKQSEKFTPVNEEVALSAVSHLGQGGAYMTLIKLLRKFFYVEKEKEKKYFLKSTKK